MTTSDQMELLRVLLDQMEMDLQDDFQPPQPSPISLDFARQLSGSSLWPLRAEQPLAAVLQQAAQSSATVVWRDDRRDAGHDQCFEVTVRNAGEGQAIELTSCEWPDGWEPLAIVIGHFDDGPSFEPAAHRAAVEKAPERRVAANEPSLTLAARDADASRAAALLPLTFSSSDLNCYYHRWETLFEVSARLPEGCVGGRAVAEMSCVASGGGTVVQRRLVELHIADGERWKGSTRFRPPARDQEHELRFLVRPFKASDLDLLPSASVGEVLADANFASMQLHPIADGFRFQPLLPHQQQFIADPDARWCLRMACADRKGVDNV